MKNQFVCLVLITISSFLFSSCGTFSIPEEISSEHFNKYNGKSLATLTEEMRDKFEQVCFFHNIYGGCVAKLLEVDDDKIISEISPDNTYFRFGRLPVITQNPNGYFLEYNDDVVIFGDEDLVLDLYGYLTTIHNLKKETKNKQSVQVATVPPPNLQQAPLSPPIKFDKNTNIPGDYFALLIANSEYAALPDLETPKTDVLALEKILIEKYKFDVTTLINAKRDDVITALYQYRKSLQDQDKLLLFYAGHGWLDTEGDEGYWLPVDADPENPIDWISNSSITTAIKTLKAKHVAVISDSCFSGKLTRGISLNQTGRKAFAGIINKKARIVISSGGIEPVLDSGGSGGHSVFAAALLDTLSSNPDIIDTTALFSQIRMKVSWNAEQVPELGIIHKAGHEGGDFFFVPKVTVKVKNSNAQ